MNDLIWVGYITGPHGLKGEIKVKTDLNHLDKIYKENNEIIINDRIYQVKTFKPYKNNYLLTIYDIDTIEKIDLIDKSDIYIKRSNINLNDNEYLLNELINFEIIFNNNSIGIIKELLIGKNINYIKNDKLIIPLIPKYIKKLDIVNKKVYVKDCEELFL